MSWIELDPEDLLSQEALGVAWEEAFSSCPACELAVTVPGECALSPGSSCAWLPRFVS